VECGETSRGEGRPACSAPSASPACPAAERWASPHPPPCVPSRHNSPRPVSRPAANLLSSSWAGACATTSVLQLAGTACRVACAEGSPPPRRRLGPALRARARPRQVRHQALAAEAVGALAALDHHWLPQRLEAYRAGGGVCAVDVHHGALGRHLRDHGRVGGGEGETLRGEAGGLQVWARGSRKAQEGCGTQGPPPWWRG